MNYLHAIVMQIFNLFIAFSDSFINKQSLMPSRFTLEKSVSYYVFLIKILFTFKNLVHKPKQNPFPIGKKGVLVSLDKDVCQILCGMWNRENANCKEKQIPKLCGKNLAVQQAESPTRLLLWNLKWFGPEYKPAGKYNSILTSDHFLLSLTPSAHYNWRSLSLLVPLLSVYLYITYIHCIHIIYLPPFEF